MTSFLPAPRRLAVLLAACGLLAPRPTPPPCPAW
jgi:hypothetical protein